MDLGFLDTLGPRWNWRSTYQSWASIHHEMDDGGLSWYPVQHLSPPSPYSLPLVVATYLLKTSPIGASALYRDTPIYPFRSYALLSSFFNVFHISCWSSSGSLLTSFLPFSLEA